MAIKGAIEGFRGAMSKREKLRRAKKKDSVHPIGYGENGKARSLAKKKGPTMGLEPEPTWAGQLSYSVATQQCPMMCASFCESVSEVFGGVGPHL